MSILFPFESGWTSAIYFVIFEVIIAVLLFSITASSYRYFISQLIASGNSVTVYEWPIPVIGRELQIGKLWFKLFHYVTRAIALLAIFIINLYTIGRTGPILSPITRNYVALQNAENSDWFKNGTYRFQRDFPGLKGCQLGTEDGVEFYNIALDTVNGETGIEDFDPASEDNAIVALDFSEALCLDGVGARPKEVAMTVFGCGSQGRKCYHVQEVKPVTIRARVNTLSSRYATRWLYKPRKLVGFEAKGDIKGECVVNTGRSNYCGIWTDNDDRKSISFWVSVLISSSTEFLDPVNGTFVDLKLKRTSPVIEIVGGRFGSISVGHAMALSTSIHPTPVLEIVNHIYSQSVEFFPRTAQYQVLNGERNVTEIQLPAIVAGGVVIAVLVLEIFVWCWRFLRNRNVRWMAKRLRLVGLFRTWQEDVQPTGNCSNSQLLPEIGITDTGHTTQHFGLIHGKACPLDPSKETKGF